MYLDHYGLKEAPFSITPDPRFVFLSDRHRDALAHLIYGISQGGGGGFVQLTGEVGTGKTTLSRLLLEQLPERTRVALVLNPRLKPVELLEAICEELRLDVEPMRGNGKALVDALNRYLLEAHAQNVKIVLILDEAQQLSVESLEQVRLLTNLETSTHKLLQIALLGQPELRELLDRPDLRQLAQRITARYHLTPLNAEETEDYVRHRLAVAGLTRTPFTLGAMKTLHRRSGGVPRLINVIAERALLTGYARDATKLDARLLNEAADELLAQPGPLHSALGRFSLPAAGLAAMLLVAAGLFWLQRERWQTEPPMSSAQAVDTAPASMPSLSALLDAIGDDEAVARALLVQWQADPALAERMADCPFHLNDGDLYCVRSRGALGQLSTLNRPALLLVPHGGAVRPVAIIGLDDTHAQISTGEDSVKLPRESLASAWPGEYLAVLRLPDNIPPVATNRLPTWALAALSRCEANRSLPALSDQTERIRRLQRMHGLRPDGVTGPETWWALSAYLDDGPRLNRSTATIANR